MARTGAAKVTGPALATTARADTETGTTATFNGGAVLDLTGFSPSADESALLPRVQIELGSRSRQA